MAKQIINVGTTANDRKGDSLRAAFTKVNANFTDLYTALGLNADTTLNLGAFEFNGSVMSTTDSTAITIDQTTTITSDLTVGGDILPNVNLGGNLGSPTQQWKSLYVSTNTIYINNIPVSLDSSNNLLVNDTPISQAIAYTDIPNAPTDVADLTDLTGLLAGGNANTGDIGFNNTVMYSLTGLNVSNADLTHGATAALTLPANGTGDVELGNLYGSVAVTAGTDADHTKTWVFGTDGRLTAPVGGGVYNSDGAIVSLGYSNNKLTVGSNIVRTPVQVTMGGLLLPTYTWTFDEDGIFRLPAGGDIVDSTGTSVLGTGGTTLPVNAAGVLTNDGSGNLSWEAAGGAAPAALPVYTYANKSATITADASGEFSSDGTKYLYQDSGIVYEYTLGTAWDISTATQTSTVDLSSLFGSNIITGGLTFKSDGTEFQVVETPNFSSFYISKVTLSTPWDINSTLARVQGGQLPSGANGSPAVFSDDGTKYYHGWNGRIYQWNLSTAWDISLIDNTPDTNYDFYVGGTGYWPNDLAFTADGTSVYITSQISSPTLAEKVIRYSLGTAWDISTATVTTDIIDIMAIGIDYLDKGSITFSPDRTKMYVAGGLMSKKIYQLNGITAGQQANGSYTFPDGTNQTTAAISTGDVGFSGNVLYNKASYDQGISIAPGGESTSYVQVPGNAESATTPLRIGNAGAGGVEILANKIAYAGDITQSYQDSTACSAGVETVIYTSTSQWQHAIKMFVMVEGSEDGTGTWQTQACDIIAVKGFVDNIIHVTAYGVTYSGAAPLATFDGQWNALTNRIEITCIPTHPTNNVYASVHAIEMTTND